MSDIFSDAAEAVGSAVGAVSSAVEATTSDSSAAASESAPAAGDAASSGTAASAVSLSDDHHDWATSFTGIDTRAGASGATAAGEAAAGAASGASGGAAASASAGASSGGLWGDITNAVSDVASGVVNTAENVAGDAVHAVSDAATGMMNTATTAATGIENTVVDAASGMWNTAQKVGGDIASGNLGDALGDTAAGVASTTGHVVSDVAHTAVDTASAGLDATGKVLIDAEQGVSDAATGAISTAGRLAGDAAHTVADAAGPNSMIGQAANAAGNFAGSAASAAVGAVNTVTDFNKGVVEGVTGGVEGMAKGLVNLGDSAGREAYALATDPNARAQAADTVIHGAEAVGQFEQTMVTDPGKALGQVGGAIESGAQTVGRMAEGVYDQYQQAAAAGHGAEFIGKGVGQAAVVVAGAVLTDGAGLAGEGAAVAGEGAALVGEGAVVAGEGAAAAGGVTAAEELGSAATQLAGRGATTAEELGTATTQVADRGAAAAEELGEVPAATPGADPGPLPPEFEGPSKPIKLFDKELQPIEPGSPNLTATPKAGDPIPFELGEESPAGQVQLRPGDGSPVADPLAQTQEIPVISPLAQTGEMPAMVSPLAQTQEMSAVSTEAETAAADLEEGAGATGETPRDPAVPRERVQRSPTDQRLTRPLGNIASHDEQGLALQDAAGARTSESEHILSRANIAEQTRNPATGVSPFDNTTKAGMANYDDATTLKLGRETAVEKTAGDNAAWRALKNSGGAPTPQMLEDSGLEAAINRTLDAAQTTGDTSVTAERVNLAAHGELGKVFEVGTSDAKAALQGVSDDEIDAALDLEKATVDPRFAAPKGMGLPLRGGPTAGQAAAGAASETADTSAAAEAEIEAEAEAEIEETDGAPPPGSHQR